MVHRHHISEQIRSDHIRSHAQMNHEAAIVVERRHGLLFLCRKATIGRDHHSTSYITYLTWYIDITFQSKSDQIRSDQITYSPPKWYSICGFTLHGKHVAPRTNIRRLADLAQMNHEAAIVVERRYDLHLFPTLLCHCHGGQASATQPHSWTRTDGVEIYRGRRPLPF